ncbi:hypothetical protein [Streptomyces bohaiensis]|uniref:Insertion element protein n=1 Tax=Streptomyces bohaiensis TaxID=1431344 RepID=A0ABX1CED7_9ACTN|nr:hypothetical protein [Streptomyces bohaiensis]NJQ15762.1 hypothetical protein [Streptomyces bohaiensis]
MSERAAPYYCPYCGEEDLRPSEEGHGCWECPDCNRAFRLKFLGLLAAGFTRSPGDRADDTVGDRTGERSTTGARDEEP